MQPLKLVTSQKEKADWFDQIISNWINVSQSREIAARNEEAAFIRKAVEHLRETTDEQHVLDRCNSWLGRRS